MLLPHYEAERTIIDECLAKKDELSTQLMDLVKNPSRDSDLLSKLNYDIMYLDKAIEGRIQDYELMGLVYKRRTA